MNSQGENRPLNLVIVAAPIWLLVLFLSVRSAPAADLPELKDQAARGDVIAQVSLGIAYRDGKVVDRNYAEAVSWFRKAAEKNDAAALDNLGWMCEHGSGIACSLEEAVKYYRAAAEKGHAQAQWNLGRMYAGAYWGHLDIKEAARWYRRAAENGHRDAQHQLGLAYLQGMGVPADDVQAYRWFSASADQGNVEAMLAVGSMYSLGRGVAGSEKEARAWFSKAMRPKDHRAADALEWLDLQKRPAVRGHFVCLNVPHVTQGWWLCAAAAAAMATGFYGQTADQLELKRLSGSPLGEGTDWSNVIAAAAKLGRRWELLTFPDDEAGFREGKARMMASLDAGHPILLDITVGAAGMGSAGHTLLVVGYDAAGERWIINNPAMGPPGIQIFDAAALKKRWHSRWYTHNSPGISRPIILTR